MLEDDGAEEVAPPLRFCRLKEAAVAGVGGLDRGVLKPGFERTHPYHLAMTLGRTLRDRRKLEPGADAYVRRYLRKNDSKEALGF